MFKTPKDIIPIDLGVVFVKAGEVELYRQIRTWSMRQDYQLPIIPVHGDLTPWHLYVSLEEKIVLTDYERAGWHVPYYDYFHFVLQPLALKGDAPSILKVMNFDMDYTQIRQVLCLYLIDQLYHDMVNAGKGHPVAQLIENKKRWLGELLVV